MDQQKNERKILIGITSNVIIDRVGLRGYDMISKAGFECIDFNMQRGFYNVKDNSYNSDFLDIIEIHRRRIVECGLKISQTHAPYYYTDYHIKNEIDLKKYLDSVDQALKATILLQCKYMVVHPLYILPWMKQYGINSNEELTEIMLKKILPRAKMANVKICIENLPYDFCNDLESHKKFVSLFEDDNIKACFDYGHSKIRENNPSIHLHNMRNWIHIVHMHDNDAKIDLHDRIRVDKDRWDLIMREIYLNVNIECFSLETSGIYKKCEELDIEKELFADYKTVKELFKTLKEFKL